MLLAPVSLIDVNMGFIGAQGLRRRRAGRLRLDPGRAGRRHHHRPDRALAGAYLPDGFKDTAPYIVLLIMLVVRPQGLFGTMARKKV